MSKERVVCGNNISKSTRVIGLIAMSGVAMSGCGGTSMVKEPETLQATKPVATSCDDNICANIDWVIVRNGPGSWAKNATWDEYLILVVNQAGQSVTIQNVTVIDSLSYRLTTEDHRAKLARQSSDTIRRYRRIDLTVKAGDGTGALLAAGGTATVVGVGLGVAAASTYGAAAATAAGVGVGILVLGPALLAGGLISSGRARKVNKHLQERSTAVPVEIAAAEKYHLDLFFPYGPSPRRVEVAYTVSGQKRVLRINTESALDGLHFESEQVD